MLICVNVAKVCDAIPKAFGTASSTGAGNIILKNMRTTEFDIIETNFGLKKPTTSNYKQFITLSSTPPPSLFSNPQNLLAGYASSLR